MVGGKPSFQEAPPPERTWHRLAMGPPMPPSQVPKGNAWKEKQQTIQGEVNESKVLAE